MITDTVLDQVFGDKAMEKYGKNFMSMHISDQHPGKHRKMMLFKFSLPDAKHMNDIVRLVALIPYYIDLADSVPRHGTKPRPVGKRQQRKPTRNFRTRGKRRCRRRKQRGRN